MTLRPFGRLAAGQRAGAEAEAERLAAFLGAPLSLSAKLSPCVRGGSRR